MSTFTAVTVPTQFVEANGIRFAYRRFGKAGGVPLVFNMHYLRSRHLVRKSSADEMGVCRYESRKQPTSDSAMRSVITDVLMFVSPLREK
jgi:hypothetical protein